MSTQLLSRTLYYKQCRIDDAPATLSELLIAALKAKEIATDRMQVTPHDVHSVRLINDVVRDKAWIFGSLVEWTAGKWQNVISVEPGRPAFEVSQFPPGDRQEFLEGMGYFLAYRNHVVFARGRAIGSAAIEDHLQWLLRDCAQLVGGDADLYLNDAPQKPGSPLSAPVNQVTLTPAPIREGKRKSGYATESIAARDDIARAFIDRLRQMKLIKLGEEKLDQLLASRNLRASIKLSYTKSENDDGGQILDVLAQALRNADGEWGYVLNVPGVGRVHGGELTLKTSVLVPHGSGLDPQPDALAAQMWSWLTGLIARQEVPAEV